MAEYLIYTADHEYWAYAPNERCRDNELQHARLVTRKEPYARPYEVIVRAECQPGAPL